MMIKVVSFDIGGTLLKDVKDNNYSIKDLASLINKPYEEVKIVYKDVFQKSMGTLEELVNNFCLKLNIEVTKEIKDFIQNKYQDSNDIKMNNKDIELIKYLKEHNYKVILFSNSCVLQKSSIPKEVIDICDGIFYSYELGYTKSDKKIYQIIENKLNCLPEEFLHIGDNLHSDYLMPIQNGWHALYYGEINDKEIDNILELEEIKDYLKKD